MLLVAQAAADQVALQLGFKGYAELEREEPFFDASTAVRNQQVRPKSTFPSAPATNLLHAFLVVWLHAPNFLQKCDKLSFDDCVAIKALANISIRMPICSCCCRVLSKRADKYSWRGSFAWLSRDLMGAITCSWLAGAGVNTENRARG